MEVRHLFFYYPLIETTLLTEKGGRRLGNPSKKAGKSERYWKHFSFETMEPPFKTFKPPFNAFECTFKTFERKMNRLSLPFSMDTKNICLNSWRKISAENWIRSQTHASIG